MTMPATQFFPTHTLIRLQAPHYEQVEAEIQTTLSEQESTQLKLIQEEHHQYKAFMQKALDINTQYNTQHQSKYLNQTAANDEPDSFNLLLQRSLLID